MTSAPPWVSCPVCGQDTVLDSIERIDPESSPDPWSRVKMKCGHQCTLRAEDAAQVAAVAAGRLAAATFPDPDSNEFIHVFARRPAD